MIKTLENFELGDLLSDSLKKDENIAALAYALTPIFQDIFSKTKLIQMFEGIPEHLLDFAAYEEAAEFYDVNMTNDQKRIIIANAESIHKTKGTVAAVEDVITPFFSKGKVSEWFEYGGEPFHFQIYTNEYLKNEQDIAKLFRMVNTVKRKSTRLERVFFNWPNGIAVEAIEAEKNIEIHPMAGTFLCGQWPEVSTLGRLIDGGLSVQREDYYKVESTYEYPGFFANSKERAEMLQEEFSGTIQVDRKPLDYSNVDFLMANKSLMVGDFKTGSTEVFEDIQVSAESNLTIKSEKYTSIQDEFFRTGQVYTGSKEEIINIQKDFSNFIQLERAPLDYSNVEFLMANGSLMVGKFKTGSQELFEDIQVSSESNLTIRSENYSSTQEELTRTGQFFLGSKEELEKIQKEYLQNIEIGMVKDMSLVEYMAARDDLKMNFLVGSIETFEQYTRTTTSSLELTDEENTTVSNYKLTGQFYAGEGD
ncbi:phage tail protein I [Bacillus sp. Au-Bac7]|uniref:phage tail protein I n=1 Tax=Bacillus sp. Au-Bac7 TaxID=2906458 RepID=UPI001E524ABF|nr:phage tail protein I [Bacillus sp. Au-Bac7]MCE4048014.1 phage tail protein I [Bacillus sp. Au-Bac7]